ncbi:MULTISPECIES: hypothetical protein [unclassified Picosynechococcus]|nr:MULTISPECIES: hypothetical protein [unclassified Picosynechococcus]
MRITSPIFTTSGQWAQLLRLNQYRPDSGSITGKDHRRSAIAP